MTETTKGISLETFEGLVPWYVSGQLSSVEQQQVKQFLEENPEYKKQIEIAEEEQSITITDNEMLGGPSAGALDKLMQEIKAETGTSILSRLNSWLEPATNWLGDLRPLAMTAAAIIIVVQMGTIGLMVSDKGADNGGRFKPAFDTKEVMSKGSYVYIHFASHAPLGEVHKFLEEHEAVLVEAPEEAGVLKVRISKKKLSQRDLEAVIKKLKSNSGIVRNVFPAG